MKNRWLLWTCLIGGTVALHARGEDPLPKTANKDSPPDAAHELHLVKALTDEWKIERSSAIDHLVLPGGTTVQGTFKCARLQVNDRPLLLEKVAAIRGSGGQGRRAKVFLRDGTLQAGELSLDKAEFISTSLGTLTLTPDNLDHVILRRTPDDGRPTAAPAGFAMHEDGTVIALATLPGTPLRLRWLGGELKVPWHEIFHIKSRPLPETAQEVRLNDGTRIAAWVFPPEPPGTFVAFARDLATLHDAAGVTAPGLTASIAATRDRSQWTGRWAQETIHISTPGSTVTVRTADIRRVISLPPEEFEISTRQGATIRGIVLDETLAWNTSVGVVALPWRLITRIGGSEK